MKAFELRKKNHDLTHFSFNAFAAKIAQNFLLIPNN